MQRDVVKFFILINVLVFNIPEYTTASIWVEGVRRTGKSVAIKQSVDAIETLKDFECGGMLSPMTYTPAIHKPSDYSIQEP